MHTHVQLKHILQVAAACGWSLQTLVSSSAELRQAAENANAGPILLSALSALQSAVDVRIVATTAGDLAQEHSDNRLASRYMLTACTL